MLFVNFQELELLSGEHERLLWMPNGKYINVRRLFLMVEESIYKGTQWVVFEPNDPTLWAKVKRNITAF
jgi:phage tail sheath protein FI